MKNGCAKKWDEWRVHCKVVAIFFCLCALLVSFSTAQEISNSSGRGGRHGGQPDEAIVVGPFLFSPALQLSWQHHDNIFFTPDNEVADQIYFARARFLFELPINQSVLYFSYTPQYRDYKTYELKDKWEHFFLGRRKFSICQRLHASTSIYNYVLGNLETRRWIPVVSWLMAIQNFTKNMRRPSWAIGSGPGTAISARCPGRMSGMTTRNNSFPTPVSLQASGGST